MKNLNLMKTLIPAASILFTFSAHAGDPDKREAFCDRLVQSLDQKTTSAKKPSNSQNFDFIFRFLFNSGSMLELNQIHPARNPLSNTLSIYAIGTGKDFSTLNDRFEAYQIDAKELKKQSKNIDALFKEIKTKEACLSTYDQHKGELLEAEALYQKVAEQSKSASDQTNLKISNYIQNLGFIRQVSLKENASLSQLQDQFKTENSETIVLVFHADSSGKLFDSDWNFVPKSVFNDLNPAVKRIVIFTCHTQQVVEYYRLRDFAFNHGIEIVYPTVQNDTKWALGDSIPVNLLKPFLKKIYKISDLTSETSNSEATQGQCQVKLPSHLVNSGTLGVYLNQQFIGKRDSSEDQELNFDCSVLKGTQNTLTLQGLNLYQVPVLNQTSPFSAFITSPRGTTEALLTHDFDTEGKYIGSRSRF